MVIRCCTAEGGLLDEKTYCLENTEDSNLSSVSASVVGIEKTPARRRRYLEVLVNAWVVG